MYEVTAEADFSASHILEGYEGPCGKLHGHNYRVQVTAEGEILDALGMALDLRILKKALASSLVSLDHSHLNDLPDFASTPPSAENIARCIFERVRAALAEVKPKEVWLREVKVAETNHTWVTYRP